MRNLGRTTQRHYLLPTRGRREIARREADCRDDFRTFARWAWPVVDPAQFVWGIHVEAICLHLQAVTEGHINKLIINVSPGHAKSALTCVLWPAWEWINRPEEQSLFGSYDKDLARRDSRKCRDVFMSDWYQDVFQPQWRMRRDSNAMGFYTNTANGNRYTFGLRAGGRTGWRGNKVVIDDPISVDDEQNTKVKDDAYKRFNKTLSTRVNDPRTAKFLVIGHRVASDDLSGRLIEEDSGYEVLKLPSLSDPAKRCTTSIGWTDPRLGKDELLFPEKYPIEELEYLRTKKLGPDGFAAQHQQDPQPISGKRFKKETFRYYESRAGGVWVLHHMGRDEPILPENCWSFVSVDVAASEEQRADSTCFGRWHVTHKFDMLLTEHRMGQWDEPEIIRQAVDMYERSMDGNRRPITAFVVETNGVGLPLFKSLKRYGVPTIGVHVDKDKIAMSATAAIRLGAGSIFFPFYETADALNAAPWMPEFITELLRFPGEGHDDQVTMLSLAAEGVYVTGVGGLGGTKAVEALERPTAAQTIQFTPSQPRRSMYGTTGR